jgi:hypothetical protein
MEAGLHARGRRGGAALVVLAGTLLLVRAAPLVRGYYDKLAATHAPAVLAAAAVLALAVFLALWLGLWKRPRATLSAAAVVAGILVVLSGNLASLGAAAAILCVTFLLGDAAARLLRGVEAERGDLSIVLAAGFAAGGLGVLVLGEAGILGRISLAVLAAALVVVRRRRIPALARLVREALRLPRGDAPKALEAAWLAFAGLALLAVWAAVQGPDVSWDALAYHLPEARDIARSGRIAPLEDLAPQSLLWRNHDAYLSLGFFFGGERVVRFLQFAAGLAVFGAALALARRLGAAGASALIVLALAAFPTAMLQLRSAYVDWPAALLVTAAAAELALGRAQPGRVRLAGFLLGAAVATKVFAIFAVPALAILAWRARPRPGVLAAAAACALLALAPWLFWSERRAGFFLEPYASSPRELYGRVVRGHYFRTSPASGVPRPDVVGERLARLPRLPYDLVFHSSRFEANADGYNGVLILLLLVGIAGWRPRPILLFLAASLPFLVPWSLLYLPSVRFLFPVYPLYAVFAAEGLRRLTGRFDGWSGGAAGLTMLCAAAAFPVQLGSGGFEWKTALGRLSRQQSLAAQLPAFPLWEQVGPSDRAVFLGENDRFHCPAARAWRAEFLPVAAWRRDPEVWRQGLDYLGITHLLVREDRVDARELLQALGDRVAIVDRRGPAVLYRWRPREGAVAVERD